MNEEHAFFGGMCCLTKLQQLLPPWTENKIDRISKWEWSEIKKIAFQ